MFIPLLLEKHGCFGSWAEWHYGLFGIPFPLLPKPKVPNHELGNIGHFGGAA